MRKTRILSLILALLFVLSSVPFTAFAASANVAEIDGQRFAFISSFGKMGFNGKSYTASKSFGEALKALGAEGGRMIFSGKISVNSFKDTEGRAPVYIQATGNNPIENILDFAAGGTSTPALGGDLILNDLYVRMPEGGYIFANGHTFHAASGVDSYFESKFLRGTTTNARYVHPVSVASGEATSKSTIILEDGNFGNIVSGAVKGKSLSADTEITAENVKIENLVAGSEKGTASGNSTISVKDTKVTSLLAGNGEYNGNISVTVNGGEISKLVIRPDGGKVSGNLYVGIFGTEVGEITLGTGTVSGKTIIIADEANGAKLPAGCADIFAVIKNGMGEYDHSDGTVLLSDTIGIPAKTAIINGNMVTSENGKYTLSAAQNTIDIVDPVIVAANKNAAFVAGYADGTFLPQNNMTRAEAFTLVTRLITDENSIKGKVSANYKDAESGAWYDSYIGFLQTLGVLSQIAQDGNILPSQNITRAEFAELLYKISTLDGVPSSVKVKNFSDVPDDHKYIHAVTYAAVNGIVAGYPDGTFKPDASITRAEVVTMANRYLGRIPAEAGGAASFSDIESHWAKPRIIAAAGAENVAWTAKAAATPYTLAGKNAEEYVKGLYDRAGELSADGIRDGIDIISEQMKKDVLNTPNTLDIYADKVTGDIYYVSEKSGNDENDGLSPETAWKTMANVASLKSPKRNSAILFERGGIYRGNAGMLNNVVYGSYGEGPKPLIMQSKKNYADPALWVETEWKNVWKLTDLVTNVGIIGFDHDLFDYSESSYHEKYGLIMNKATHGFDGPEELSGDLQFYSVLTNNSVSTPGELYLYSKDGNPGSRFKSIEIGESSHIFNGAPLNVIFDNLAFKFTGAHAIAFGTCKNVRVTNCVFSWLGGSVLNLGSTGAATNYGNAVQVYGGCNGYHVENNWMYQIYDTAVTHQRSSTTGDCIQTNVKYLSNLMEYVFWGIEFYNMPPTAADLKGKKDTYRRETSNVRSAFNVLRLGGYGWGSIVRYRGSQLYCGSVLSENKNCIAEYNIFDRATGNLVQLPSNATEIQDKNIYIQTAGRPLGSLRGTGISCTYEAEKEIRERWGDKNAVVIVIDPEKEPVELELPEGLAYKG